MTITIIGTGTMGTLIKDALLKKNIFTNNNLKFIGRTNPTPKSDIYLFAVKPQDFPEAAKRLKGVKGKLIISIMAGVPTTKINKLIPGNKIVGSMPNLGIKTYESMTTWMCARHPRMSLSPKEKTLIKKIFSSFGKEFEVSSDDMIFKATALAGSGPGFLYLIADNLTKTAKKFGFKNDEAETLVKQMFIGAVKTWEASTATAKEMQEKVTSKKGTTLAGLNSFKKSRLPQILEKGLKASYKRAKELAK